MTGAINREVNLSSDDATTPIAATTPMSIQWALHNPIRSWTLYNLIESELRLLILTLSANELRSARVSRINENTWQPINPEVHPKLFVNRLDDHYFSAAGYADHDSRESTASDKEFFVSKPNKSHQPRLHTRYEVAVSCVLVGTSNKEFITATVDLSEGGLYFKDVIPNWVVGYFLVVVKDKFQLMCSIVEDQKEKKRVQIVSQESDFQFIQYKNWLDTL